MSGRVERATLGSESFSLTWFLSLQVTRRIKRVLSKQAVSHIVAERKGWAKYVPHLASQLFSAKSLC
jgi:hypothetical protein